MSCLSTLNEDGFFVLRQAGGDTSLSIMKNIDLTFITNEKNQSLKNRFEVLIKDTSFFDCLVGYFYIGRNTQGRGKGK